VSKEIKELRAKGKIADEFAEKKYAFNSGVEVFTVIDNETPNENRLEALKAMFYSVNKINATEGERVAKDQLFQIACQNIEEYRIESATNGGVLSRRRI
jgi:hypothetical protein